MRRIGTTSADSWHWSWGNANSGINNWRPAWTIVQQPATQLRQLMWACGERSIAGITRRPSAGDPPPHPPISPRAAPVFLSSPEIAPAIQLQGLRHRPSRVHSCRHLSAPVALPSPLALSMLRATPGPPARPRPIRSEPPHANPCQPVPTGIHHNRPHPPMSPFGASHPHELLRYSAAWLLFATRFVVACCGMVGVALATPCWGITDI